MAEQWRPVKASEVRPGDRVRTPDGLEITATRIEPAFFGMANMLAYIEDTPQRWLKRPVAVDSDVEVLAPD